jgi:hypothetical protein
MVRVSAVMNAHYDAWADEGLRAKGGVVALQRGTFYQRAATTLRLGADCIE